MSVIRGVLSMVAVAAAAMTSVTMVRAADPIRIGELNSYTAEADFTRPYKNGWMMAVDEINAAGGVLGRPLEVVFRDDGGEPGKAVTAADELTTKDHVDLLAGTYYSHIGVAVTNYAKQHKKLFIATEPMSEDITWKQGNRYTFRLRPNTYNQSAMLAEEAAKVPAKRWAIVAPNFKFGQDAVAAFKTVMKQKRPERRVRRGAMAGSIQDRPRCHGPGSDSSEAGGHILRSVQPGPVGLRPRRKSARSADRQGNGRRPADRGTRIPGPYGRGST